MGGSFDVLLCFQEHQLVAGHKTARGGCFHGCQIIRIRNDYHDGCRVACCLDFFKIHGQQKVSFFYRLSFFHMAGKAVAIHGNGIYACVNKQFYAGCLNAYRGGKHGTEINFFRY